MPMSLFITLTFQTLGELHQSITISLQLRHYPQIPNCELQFGKANKNLNNVQPFNPKILLIGTIIREYSEMQTGFCEILFTI